VSENLSIKLALQGERQVQAGLDSTRNKVKGLGDQTKRTGREFGGAEGKSRRFSGGLRVMRRAAMLGGAALAGGLVYGLKKSVDNFGEAQKVTAQTNAALKATGGAANVTSKDISKLGSSMQAQSGVSDEVIRSGANLLLTFRNVRNEAGKGNKVFDDATQAALDLSVAGFGSMEGTSKMLGKALNDPVKGISAMGRAGVTFTDGQKKSIKAMQESGDLLGAQKIILKEVQAQVGGSAEAYGKTLPGAIARAKETFGDLSEVVGAKLAPMITRAADRSSVFLQGMVEGTGAGGRFAGKLKTVGGALEQTGKKIHAAYKVGKRFSDWLNSGSDAADLAKLAIVGLGGAFLAYKATMGVVAVATKGLMGAQLALNVAMTMNPIGLVIAAVVGLGLAVVLAYKKFDTFRAGVDGAWGILKTTFGWVKSNWKTIAVLLTGPVGIAVAGIVKHFDKIKSGFGRVIDWLKRKWDAFANGLNAGIGAVNHVPGVNIPRIPTTSGGSSGGSGGGSGLSPTPVLPGGGGPAPLPGDETFRPLLGERSRVRAGSIGGPLAESFGRAAGAMPQGVAIVQIDKREIGRATIQYGNRVAARA